MFNTLDSNMNYNLNSTHTNHLKKSCGTYTGNIQILYQTYTQSIPGLAYILKHSLNISIHTSHRYVKFIM